MAFRLRTKSGGYALRIARRIVQARSTLLALLVCLAGIIGWGVSNTVPPDNSLRVWFVEDDPRFAEYDAYQAEWANDEVVFVHLDYGQNVFDLDVLEQVSALAIDLSEIDEVARIYSVLDLLHLTDEVGKPANFDVIQPTATELSRAAAIAREDALVRGVVVSEDQQQVALVIEPHVSADFDAERADLIREVRCVLARHESAGLPPVRLAGMGVIYEALNEVTAADFGLFLSIGFLLLLLALGLLSRSWEVVLASATVIVLGVLASLGAYGWVGHRLNLVTAMIPTLVMVLSVADVVHFPAALRRARRTHPDEPPTEIAARALAHALVPCVLTTATTAAGLLSLLSSPIPALGDLGVYAALGVVFSLFACLVLMSFVCVRLAARPTTGASIPAVDRLLGTARRLLDRHRPRLWAATAVVGALLAIGTMRLQVDTNTIGYLPEDHAVVQHNEEIEQRWGSFHRLEFVASSPGDGHVTDVEQLRQLEAFAEQASEIPGVGSVVYLRTVYEHAVLNDVGPHAPVHDMEIGELRRAAEAAHPDGMEGIVRPVLSDDGKRARLLFTGTLGGANSIGNRIEAIEHAAARTAPDLRVEATGYPPLYVEIIDQVMTTLERGFLLALLVIFVMLAIWLRSWRLLLASLVANLFPVLTIFGAMGWLGIDLDIGTAMIVSIVLGVAVDDTIHFVHAWRGAHRGPSWSASVDHAFDAAGRAAVVTTLLLLAGFPVLMLSQVTTVYAFGLLTTIAALAALAADLVVLPLMLRLVGRRPEGPEPA